MVSKAKIEKDKTNYYIVDSNGKKVNFNDPRVVHVNPIPLNPYTSKLMTNLYKKYDIRYRLVGETNREILHESRRLCLGRECLPFIGLTGAILKDISDNQENDDITIYHNPIGVFNSCGPCQYGAWQLVWDVFSEKLDYKNKIFFVVPDSKNNYLGFGLRERSVKIVPIIIGEYLAEARNALRCATNYDPELLNEYETHSNALIDNAVNKDFNLEKELSLWAEKVNKIPKRTDIETIPKILVIGGLNLLFNSYPFVDFLLSNNVLPKVVDSYESLRWLYSDSILKYGLKNGALTPKEQFGIKGSISSAIWDKIALLSQINIFWIGRAAKKYRRIMKKSGLIFSEYVSFFKFISDSHKYASFNTFSETSSIVGSFISAVNSGIYGGIINLGAFNCQPAMNSQAIIRPLAISCGIPYAVIDCEGPWISENQMRLLETIIVQAKRHKQKKE